MTTNGWIFFFSFSFLFHPPFFLSPLATSCHGRRQAGCGEGGDILTRGKTWCQFLISLTPWVGMHFFFKHNIFNVTILYIDIRLLLFSETKAVQIPRPLILQEYIISPYFCFLSLYPVLWQPMANRTPYFVFKEKKRRKDWPSGYTTNPPTTNKPNHPARNEPMTSSISLPASPVSPPPSPLKPFCLDTSLVAMPCQSVPTIWYLATPNPGGVLDCRVMCFPSCQLCKDGPPSPCHCHSLVSEAIPPPGSLSIPCSFFFFSQSSFHFRIGRFLIN